MTDLKSEDLVKLREIAEKATPGPWETGGSSVTNWHDNTFEMEWIPNGQDDAAEADGVNENAAADAEFIAAFNPQVAIALLADRARMEKALRDLIECDDDARNPLQNGIGLIDCIDNVGQFYPSQHLDDCLKAARQALGASQ